MGGSPEEHERVSTLLPGQQPNFRQLQNAAQGAGAGGAFGSGADYWYNILNDNPQLMQQFSAPEMRNFQQNTIPGLAEQFAGMGSGGLSSSGFRNASVNAGVDLQERLGALRAQLKQNASQGLMGLGQQALGNYSQDVMTQQGSPGFGATVAPLIGTAVGSMFGGIGAGVGNMAGQYLANKMQSSPYEGQGGLKRGY